jgi:hypothetical protein
VAQLERTTYGALVDEAILTPLGMTMSGTTFTEAMRAHLAPGHDETGKAVKNWDFDVLAGAGAIRSTANDMLRYLKANMGIGPSPLADAVKLAQQPRSDMGSGGTAKSMRIGLAWMTTVKGIVWHNGGTGGYRSFAGFTSDGRRSVVVLTNTAVDVDDLGFAVLDADAPLEPAHKAVVLTGASFDDYEGTYKLADNFVLKVFRMNEGLFARATGQGPVALFPSAPDEFFAKVAGISISFKRDPKGAVNGLVLHQNGDHVAPKLNASEPKSIPLDAAPFGDYIGKYRFDFGVVLDVALQGDHLDAQLTGQPALPIFASSRDRFFYKAVDALLDFERDAGGKVVAVVLHQNGRDVRAARMGTEQ